MRTRYERGLRCRETYEGVVITFKRYLGIDEEDRRIIGSHIMSCAKKACENEGIGRNPVLGTVGMIHAIERGQAEVVYFYDGTMIARRRPHIHLLH